MKKHDPFWYWLLMALGLLLILVQRLWGLRGGPLPTVAGTLLGLGLLTRSWYWSREGKAEEYARRLREQALAQTDERAVMLRDKAGRVAGQVMQWVYCALIAASFLLYWLGVWTPYSGWLGVFAWLLLAVQIACNAVAHRLLSKRL